MPISPKYCQIAAPAIAGLFGVLAYRQRIGLRWPVTGIVVLCGFVALLNVDLIITGGASAGQATAGIGVSAGSLPLQTAHAAATSVLVLLPLWLAFRRLRRQAAD
jgi:membrane protein implicated in regulation of membrane protease activity